MLGITKVRLIAILLAGALVAGACGARTDPYLGADGVAAGSQRSATGAPGGEGEVFDEDGLFAEDGAALPGVGPAGSPTGGPAGGGPSGGGGGDTATGPAGFSFDPAAQAAACPARAGNTASDAGVTPTTITFGNVSGLTGLITNSFEQGPQAVQALFSAINAHGGVCGRQLRLVVQDDGQDASKNAASHADLARRVFAFVGSTSSADNAGVEEMVRANVPDIGFAINANRGQSRVYWSAGGSTLHTVNGVPHAWNSLQNAMKERGELPRRLAVLAYAIPISADAGRQFARQFEQEGSEICYANYAVNPATASLDQDVLQMRRNNCDGVFTTMDVAGNTKLLQAQERQDWKPPYTGVTFASYTPAQFQLAGRAAEGLQVTLPFLPFEENHPVTRQYLQQLTTYQPGRQASSFGVLAWASAQMLVYALIQAGQNPTRAEVVRIFESLNDWNSGGMMTPITPRLRRPVGPCIMQMEVRNNRFVRLWPESGLYCNGRLVPVP